jgi:hypothetical protein
LQFATAVLLAALVVGAVRPAPTISGVWRWHPQSSGELREWPFLSHPDGRPAIMDAEDPAQFERAKTLSLTSSSKFTLTSRVRSQVREWSGTYVLRERTLTLRVEDGHPSDPPRTLAAEISHDQQTIRLGGLDYEAE